MKRLRIPLLALLFFALAVLGGCANGGSSDYYQRGPTKHWDSYPGHAPHGPGYYRYGRPTYYGRY